MFMYANHVGDSQSGFTPFTLINVNDKYLCILKSRKNINIPTYYVGMQCFLVVIVRANSFSEKTIFSATSCYERYDI